MQWWVYKCNSKNNDYQSAFGDWADFFSEYEESEWGSSEYVRDLHLLKKGDMVIAYQTDRNEIVGLAKVTQSCLKDGYLRLEPTESIGTKVRPLKKANSRINDIDALKQGPIRTIYRIENDEVELLLGETRVALLRKEFASPPAPSVLEPPKRMSMEIIRIVRDSRKTRKLKRLYKDRCQICSYRIKLGVNRFYSEVHHIKPLGQPHCGADHESNMIVVCPTHHACLDYGTVKFLGKNKVVIDGKPLPLNLNPKHEIAIENLDYNNEELYRYPE